MLAALVLGLVPALAVATPLVERQSVPAIQQVTPQQWAALNASVGGRLFSAYPFARGCFAQAGPNTGGSVNPQQCNTAQSGWTDEHVIADNFAGYQQTNWGTCQKTGQQCQLDYMNPRDPVAYTAYTCYQGSTANYYIDIRRPEDAVAAFNFAKQTKVPIYMKASGHDYKGRSSAPNSLGLWTHNLQSGPTLNNNFVAAGCAASTATRAVTFGAGTPFDKLYLFAQQKGVTVVGGSAQTVVPGSGWLTGGGHSSLSNTLGLGADRTLQITAVTPDGGTLVASRCQNQDLFFALRGGSSAFGMNIEVTMAVAPKLTLQVAYIRFATLSADNTAKFIALCVKYADQWMKSGWGGYIQPGAISSAPIPAGANAGGFVLFTPKISYDQAVADMAEVRAFATSLGNVALNNEVTTMPDFKSAYDKYLKPNEEVVGVATVIGSRLLPKSLFQSADGQAKVNAAFAQAMATVGTNVLPRGSPGLVYGGAPTQILVTAPSNYNSLLDHAAQPRWYDTTWHVLLAPVWNFATPKEQIQANWRKANAAAQFFRDITPGSDAAYQAQAHPWEPNWQESFYGTANYNKLMSIKPKYDSQNILTCHQCPGWVESDSRYQCYADA